MRHRSYTTTWEMDIRYENLITAIVEQVIKDWQEADALLKSDDEPNYSSRLRNSLKRRRRECECWFCSAQCRLFEEVMGTQLSRKMLTMDLNALEDGGAIARGEAANAN